MTPGHLCYAIEVRILPGFFQEQAYTFVATSVLILPYVERLLEAGLKAREQAMAEIVRERLQEIISPFLNRLTSLHSFLTPQEIQVAVLVREGRTSKAIAEAMTISVSAVDFHRKRIRKKLNMTGSGSNLRSYLLSLQL